MASEPSFRLIVRRGPQPNQVYALTKDVMTLGRDVSNDIVISDPESSRHHSRFTRSGNTYAVEDLGSTNGTFVNGQRVSGGPHALNNGDLVGVGETVTLVYEAAGVPSQAQATIVGSSAAPPAPPPRPAPAPAAPPPPPPAPAPVSYAPPRAAPPSEARPQFNRTLIIAVAVIVVIGFCGLLAAGLFLPAEFWCQVPVANQFPVMCPP